MMDKLQQIYQMALASFQEESTSHANFRSDLVLFVIKESYRVIRDPYLYERLIHLVEASYFTGDLIEDIKKKYETFSQTEVCSFFLDTLFLTDFCLLQEKYYSMMLDYCLLQDIHQEESFLLENQELANRCYGEIKKKTKLLQKRMGSCQNRKNKV